MKWQPGIVTTDTQYELLHRSGDVSADGRWGLVRRTAAETDAPAWCLVHLPSRLVIARHDKQVHLRQVAIHLDRLDVNWSVVMSPRDLTRIAPGLAAHEQQGRMT